MKEKAIKKKKQGSGQPPPFDRSQATAERWRKWHKQGYNPCATKEARHAMSVAQKRSWQRRSLTGQ